MAVQPGGRTWSVNYDEAGIDALVVQLNRLAPASVITESTGGLELSLVTALAPAPLPVVVVNPRQVRDFAKFTGRLAKTDRPDAQVLAHFGEAVRPEIRPLRNADTQALGAMLARRRQCPTSSWRRRTALDVPQRKYALALWPTSSDWNRNWRTWMVSCAGGSVVARYGGRRMTCCAVFPE